MNATYLKTKKLKPAWWVQELEADWEFSASVQWNTWWPLRLQGRFTCVDSGNFPVLKKKKIKG